MGKNNFAIIFDMDGVLIDTVQFHWVAMNQVLAKYDVHIEDSQLRNYIGQSVIVQLEKISKEYNVTLDIDAIVEGLKPIKEELQKGIQPKDGVVQLLKLLKEEGVPLAVGTSSTTIDTNRKLKDAGILDYFDVIVTHDDVTMHKPDPTVYLMAAQKIHMEPRQCVVFEDAPSGILAANRAGMKCIALRTPFTEDRDLAGADYIVSSLEEVDIEYILNV